jgi:hypothetical protein
MNTNLSTPLTPLQIELLKAFSMQSLDEKDIHEIRLLLSKYFANKASKMAQKLASERGWTPENIENLQFQHNRHTPQQ